MKKIMTFLLVLSSYNDFVFAETIVDGLPKDVPLAYRLSIEVSSNDSNKIMIQINPVNHVFIAKSNYPFEKPIIVLNDRLKESDYKIICELARKSISNFQFLKAPRELNDGLHFKLTLNINRRQISIKYFSLSHSRDGSISMHNILSKLRNYLPEKEKLLLSKI